MGGVPINVDLPVIDHIEVASGHHGSTSGDRVVSVSTGTNVIDVDTAPSSVKILEDRLVRGMIATASTKKQMHDLLVENAFLSLKVDNLERGMEEQRKGFDDMKFEYESRNTCLEMDAVGLAAEVLVLREDLETSKKLEVDVAARTTNEISRKNKEIQNLKIKLSKQKALNKQLFLRVAIAETDTVSQQVLAGVYVNVFIEHYTTGSVSVIVLNFTYIVMYFVSQLSLQLVVLIHELCF